MRLQRIDDHPSVFWHWNDRLRKREIGAKVDQLHAFGVRSFLIHPMPDHFRKEDFFEGMTTPYLSPAFFEAVRCAVERASALGMRVWIYDEAGWPSGQAGGLLLKQYPHLRAEVMTPDGLVPALPERTDLLHPETTPCFMSLTHARYKAAVGDFFGTTILGVFTDEWDVPGQVGTPRLPWTDDIEKVFEERTGQPLRPLLPWLFGHGRTDEAKNARVQYAEVWTSLVAERFLAPIRAFCHRNDLVLTGHFLGDQSLRGHARCNGHFLKLMHQLDEPGIDTVWGQINGQAPKGFFPSFASSCLKRKGQRCWSESFAAYGFGLSIQEMKRIADFQLVQGINKFAPMLMLLSTRGPRWIQTASRPLDKAPDAAHYADLNTYLAATGKRLREGDLFRPIRIPYPIEELWADYGRTSVSTAFNRLAGKLADRNIGFVCDPSSRETHPDVLERQFHKAWPFPQRVEASRKIRWIAFSRQKQNFLFCVNIHHRPQKITFSPSGISWTLSPWESRFLSLDHPVPDKPFQTALRLTEWEISPLCQWILQDGVPHPIPLKNKAWQPCKLDAWIPSLGPHFSGSAIYRSSFHWKKDRKAWLDLGKVNFAVHVSVNGQAIGKAAWSPFRFSIGKYLRTGKNTIQLQVDGSLANLIHSPHTQKELKQRGWWNVYMERTSSLEAERMDSGLHGPVKILVPQKV